MNNVVLLKTVSVFPREDHSTNRAAEWGRNFMGKSDKCIYCCEDMACGELDDT
jgi:hypothetical protein